MKTELIIKETLLNVKSCYVAPDIPEKKLNNAINSIAKGKDPEYVAAICDVTLLGSAKDGCVFFGDSLYWKAPFEKPGAIKYEEIIEAKYEEESIIKDNGKKEIKKYAYIHLHTNTTINIIEAIPGDKGELFVDLINKIVNSSEDGEEFVATNQCLPLQSMSSEIKLAYVKLICNFAFANDGEIDAKEYAELTALLVRVEVDAENRILIREYMNSVENLEENEILLDSLEELVPDGSWEILQKSLMKDILYLYRLENNIQDWKSNKVIIALQKKLGISDEQISLLVKSIKADEDILNQRKSDTEIVKSAKEMAAGAAAVGVPLAAIYFSGSVVGMSAAGMTSGLAALGVGSGFLGLSSMATGIGMVAVIGVVSYKGVKKVTGLSEIENNSQRELMLQAIIKNSQKSLNYMIEDVNTMSQTLTKLLADTTKNELQLKKLAAIIGKLSKGAELTSNRINYAETETIFTKIPKTLNISRLEEMTNSATKEKCRTFVLECYQKKSIEDENGKLKEVYRLDYELEYEKASQLYDILESIGYLSLKETSMASAKGLAKKVARGILQ